MRVLLYPVLSRIKNKLLSVKNGMTGSGISVIQTMGRVFGLCRTFSLRVVNRNHRSPYFVKDPSESNKRDENFSVSFLVHVRVMNERKSSLPSPRRNFVGTRQGHDPTEVSPAPSEVCHTHSHPTTTVTPTTTLSRVLVN